MRSVIVGIMMAVMALHTTTATAQNATALPVFADASAYRTQPAYAVQTGFSSVARQPPFAPGTDVPVCWSGTADSCNETVLYNPNTPLVACSALCVTDRGLRLRVSLDGSPRLTDPRLQCLGRRGRPSRHSPAEFVSCTVYDYQLLNENDYGALTA